MCPPALLHHLLLCATNIQKSEVILLEGVLATLDPRLEEVTVSTQGSGMVER